MIRNVFPMAAPLAAALALAACVAPKAPAPVTVSNVEVDVDLSAIATRQAAHHWSTLEADIAGALGEEFLGMTSPQGYLVRVDVDELSLAALSSPRLGADEARLTGRIEMVDVMRDKVVRSFAVSASSNEAALFLPPGGDIAKVSPSSHEFYEAVVRAFAHGTAETVRAGATPPPA